MKKLKIRKEPFIMPKAKSESKVKTVKVEAPSPVTPEIERERVLVEKPDGTLYEAIIVDKTVDGKHIKLKINGVEEWKVTVNTRIVQRFK